MIPLSSSCPPLVRKDQHIFLPHIQHIPHLRPGEDQCFQFPGIDGNFPRDALPDLGDAAALVVGDLALVRFVGPVVLHGTGPEAVVDFVARHDLLRLFGQDRKVMEARRLQLDRTAPVEKELLAFVHEDDRRIGDQFPKVFGICQAGAQGGKDGVILEEFGEGARK